MKHALQPPKSTPQPDKQASTTTRTKKLNISRNNIKMRQSSKPITRLKSNHQITGEPVQVDMQEKVQMQKANSKPLSSMGKRPASSRKFTESAHSATTTSSAKSEQQIKQLIGTIFTHSKKLHSYLQQQNIDQHHAYTQLTTNELFTLSLIPSLSSLSQKNPEEVSKHVEKSCISKLERISAMEQQRVKCRGIEERIQGLIQRRIRELGGLG